MAITKKKVTKAIKPKAKKKTAKKTIKSTTTIIKKPNKKLKKARKNKYSNQELKEFKVILLQKLEEARKEHKYLHDSILHLNEHGTDDTASSFKSFEDTPTHIEKEYLHQMADRQRQFINHLENALVRIENKSYGVCRVTGKLISKERLKSVPHATLSIEAKLNQQEN